MILNGLIAGVTSGQSVKKVKLSELMLKGNMLVKLLLRKSDFCHQALDTLVSKSTKHSGVNFLDDSCCKDCKTYIHTRFSQITIKLMNISLSRIYTSLLYSVL